MNGTSSAVAAGTAQVPYLFRKYAVDLTGPKNRYPIPCDPSEEENARRDPRQARRQTQRQQEQTVEQGWDSDVEQQFDALLVDNKEENARRDPRQARPTTGTTAETARADC
ncbi:hypothetical protein PG996_004167 [Apiospora saccharicola]|uniref:Uncharacterized protein n=1 Tax=Apiospora saccharicola TaxID=335842 RepID=A0ABR1W3I8_9PEZI